MAQILVKVLDISVDEHGRPTELNGTERILTYKAFQYKLDAFQLIAQVKEDGTDADGNSKYTEIPGNPNLNSQHRTQAQPKSAGHAAETVSTTGPVIIQPAANEVAKEQTEKVRRKPGPKPRQLQEQTA